MLQLMPSKILQIIWLGMMLAFYPGSVIAQENGSVAEQIFVADFLFAAKTNDLEALKSALAEGVNVDSKDQQGRTALLVATYNNSIAAAKILIAAGADVNVKDKLRDSPYLYAGAEGKVEILKMTVAAGAHLNSVNRYGGTALTPAAHQGHVEVVAFLVTTKIDIDQANSLGWTALLEAVVAGNGGAAHQKIVQILLEAGARKEIGDKDGKTPLQHARDREFTEIIYLLEKSGN